MKRTMQLTWSFLMRSPIPSRGVAALRCNRTVLAIAAPLALLISQPMAARAFGLDLNGIHYDLDLYVGSYLNQPGYFALPANGGRMSWWGDQTLAGDLASALVDGLSPSPLPSEGPLFAYAYDGTNVTASFFDLTTLGITNTVVDDALFSPSSTYSWVVLANGGGGGGGVSAAPAPLPLLGTVAAFSAARRMRRRLKSNR